MRFVCPTCGLQGDDFLRHMLVIHDTPSRHVSRDEITRARAAGERGRIKEHADKVAAAAPPLTEGQRDRLRALLTT